MSSCLDLNLQWFFLENRFVQEKSNSESPLSGISPLNSLPEDLIEVAKIIGSWGLKGQISVEPYSETSVLNHAKILWLQYRWHEKKTDSSCIKTYWAKIEIKQKPKYHSGVLLFRWDNIDTPEQAHLLKSCRIFVSRSLFPEPAVDEFYCSDLIGLRVKNLDLQDIGVVKNISENGAHSVLEVLCAKGEKNIMVLIPFVNRHVPKVDMEKGFLVVDWYFD